MNQQFKEWIIGKFVEIPDEPKIGFLRDLKLNPEKVRVYIYERIASFAFTCMVEKQIVVDCRPDQDPQEVLEALQQHFAKELELITQ